MGLGPENQQNQRPLADAHSERIDRAWDSLEEGNVESAGFAAEVLMDETDEHPEVRFLFGAALLESGLHGAALEVLLASEDLVEDRLVHRFYLATAYYENLQCERAEALFRQVLAEESDAAPPHYAIAQSLEFMGRYEEAERHYEKAHELENYPLPTRMKTEAFERVVQQSLEMLPEELRVHANRVAIVVEQIPTPEILRSEGEDESITPGVLGLFVGPNFKERSNFSPVATPPTIFVYQRNLERFCQTREELIYEIKLTLYHEFGHYLGLSEDELDERGLS